MRPRLLRQRYLQFLRELVPLSHAFVMGGFAEDALLEREFSRDHADLDLLVEVGLWDALQAQLRDVGITRFEPLYSGLAGEPLALASKDRGLQIEVWLAERLTDGYAIVLPGDASTLFRLRLPSDTFQSPKAVLEDVLVQTISPLALSLFRATSAQTRGDRQKRLGDLQVVERLARKYLTECDPADLVPNVAELHAP